MISRHLCRVCGLSICTLFLGAALWLANPIAHADQSSQNPIAVAEVGRDVKRQNKASVPVSAWRQEGLNDWQWAPVAAGIRYGDGDETGRSAGTSAPPPGLLAYPYLGETTPTSVAISWVTDGPGASEVHYSLDQSYNNVVTAASDIYDGKYWHSATISGLSADSTYYYKVYTKGRDLTPWPQITFTTAPDPTASQLTFVAFGDSRPSSGSNPPSQAAVDLAVELDQHSFDLALHVGDMVYQGGICSGATSAWNQYLRAYFALYREIIGDTPFYPAVGNHDLRDGSCGYDAFTGMYQLPENGPTGYEEQYYSFDWGNAHFVAVDTNQSYVAGSRQYNWLVNDLATSTQPWKFVFFHHPPYSSGRHGSALKVRTHLVPVFEDYGVDVVFAGHDHAYERTCPIVDDTCTTPGAGGVVYYVTAGGGASLYEVNGDWFTAYGASVYHFTKVSINDCRLRVDAVDRDGVVFDSYQINHCGVLVAPEITSTPMTDAFVNEPYTYDVAATGNPPPTYTLTVAPFDMGIDEVTGEIAWTPNATGAFGVMVEAVNSEGVDTQAFTITVQNVYTLAVNSAGHGVVTVNPDRDSYHYGDVVTLTAVPDPGWRFAGWSGDLSGSENPATITMDGDKTVTVTFIQDEYILTVNTVGVGSVNVDPDQAVYHYGDVVTLTAVSDPGWSFAGWSGDLSGANNPVTITMAGHKSVTVTFTQDEYNLTVNIVGVGSVNVDPDQAVYHYGDVVTLTAVPDPGWSFAGWSGDLSGVDNPDSLTIAGDAVVTATLTQDDYTLTVDVVGSGAVDLQPHRATYHYGDVITLTAVPDPGWSFAGWSGDLSGANNPDSLTIRGDSVVTATLARETYSVTVDVVGSGAVDTDPDRDTYHHGDVVTFTANPDPGWSFFGWRGDLAGADSPTKLTLNSGKLVTATFDNSAPVLDRIGNHVITSGLTLSFTVSASDPDGLTPSLRAVNLPVGASFLDRQDGSGSFGWRPDSSDLGRHRVTFLALDGFLTASETITITVSRGAYQLFLPLVTAGLSASPAPASARRVRADSAPGSTFRDWWTHRAETVFRPPMLVCAPPLPSPPASPGASAPGYFGKAQACQGCVRAGRKRKGSAPRLTLPPGPGHAVCTASMRFFDL